MRRVHWALICVLLLSMIGTVAACGKTSTATTTTTSKTTTPATTAASTTSATVTTSKPAATTTPAAPVKIGLLEDITGPYGTYGVAFMAGAKTAVQMVNDAGGIKSLGGAKIVTVDGNGDSTPTTSTSEVERLINNEKVLAISGPTSTAEALASIPLFERYKIPAVTILTDETQYQKGYRYVFGVAPSNQLTATVQANFVDWLAKTQGAPTDRIAICSLTPGLDSRVSAMITRLKSLGYTNIVLNETFTGTVSDQGPLVLKLKAANPSLVIYLGGAQDGILFHKACYTYDYYPWLVMDEETYGSPLVSAGLSADVAKKTLLRPNVFGVGVGATDDLLANTPSIKAFHDAFKKLYPGSTMPLSVVSRGGLKVLAIARAIENAGSRAPDAIADALRKLDIKAPDTYLILGDQYPRFLMSDSGLVSTMTLTADQWNDTLTGKLFIWPDNLSNSKPRIQK